ncbi:NAD+ synthase [Candidatus Peregrinibacteria bacterium]|nr:NAD+ synthase [Candidatus Peregrinibacteria bacterium]
MNASSAYSKIIKKIKQYFENSEYKNAVIGVSGGVDSALVLKLVVDALGPERVAGIIMPELGVTKTENTNHAKALCNFLGVKTFTVPINKFLMEYAIMPWKPTQSSQINLRPRVRMTILYNYANAGEALVIGTSNKSEILLGYGTKYGDLAADIEPLGDLYKTDIYKLAEHVGLPKEIIEKAPTAELYKDQTDESELGASYTSLDNVLRKLNLGKMVLIEKGMNPAIVNNVFSRVSKNKHKTEGPYIIEITEEE